jgi:thioesterase domain-containing protein
VPGLRVHHLEADHLELLEAPRVAQVAAILARDCGRAAARERLRTRARRVDQPVTI